MMKSYVVWIHDGDKDYEGDMVHAENGNRAKSRYLQRFGDSATKHGTYPYLRVRRAHWADGVDSPESLSKLIAENGFTDRMSDRW